MKNFYITDFTNFWIKTNVFNYWFGFRNHHSTNHALISITEKIRNALDESKFASRVFLDFQKAFDTVNHKILIPNLEHYGIRGLPLHLAFSKLFGKTNPICSNKQKKFASNKPECPKLQYFVHFCSWSIILMT